jgi:hypothetical protein
MSIVNEIKRLTPEELLEKRRLTLLSRTHAARLQLDSLSLLDSSYDTCRQTLRQWRLQMLDQINKAHETSLAELNNAYEQLNHFRSTIDNLLNEQESNDQSLVKLTHIESSLNTLRQAEFSFDFDRASQLNGELQLLELSNLQQLIRRINCQTPECILVCPFD